MTSSRYLVGIDLGTTNTVVAYCEISADLSSAPVSLFAIDQLIGPGEVIRKPLLPSFRYHPAPGQISDADLTLPWEHKPVRGDIKHVIIGEWAREQGARSEGRQVSSAKSWLSHQGVDRHSDILPWSGTDDTIKVSPVVASASYLNHIRQAWNYHHHNAPLEEQDVVVTVPASFDETARKLTLEAATLAGLPQIKLLEEPQAACYDWYARHQQTAAQELADLPLIMVCDVGGGTTDFSLITAQSDSESQGLTLNRIGVGDHLMLGGDNIDLALAHLAEQRFSGSKKLNAAALSKLIQQTRSAKEQLLSAQAPDTIKITMLGSGSKLLGGSRSITLSKQEVHQIALDGFFPQTPFTVLPDKRRSAVVEFGLPYASDPAISKYSAEFLTQHQQVSRQAAPAHSPDAAVIPSALLLNGGAFNSPLITERFISLLSQWRGAPVTLLDNPHPDWAVALGAVAYAKARRGAQLKIGGGSARSYFLHLTEKNRPAQALCLLAKGTQEGEEIRLTGRRFALTLGEPVRFNLLTSTHDTLGEQLQLQNGMVCNADEELFRPLPPYIATLAGSGVQLAENQKERVTVQLACQLTEVGTLKLECVAADDDTQRWQLEFEVRHQQEEDKTPTQHPQLANAQDLITQAYSGNTRHADNKTIKTLFKDIEKRLGKRDDWEFATLRALYDTLATGKKRRRRSAAHEKNWLRLAGFTLRPGFGDATDSWRLQQLWPLYQQGIQFPSHQSWSDWWTLWRRVAGGLDQEQQETILADIAKYLHPGAMNNAKSAQQAQDRGYEAMVRLAASLEHLQVEDKTLLATWFFNKARRQSQFAQAHWWALGRLASRTLFYGSQHTVLPRSQVQQWLPEILKQDWNAEPMAAFATVMMCRKTGDRLLDIDDDLRTQVLEKLTHSKSGQSWIDLVANVCTLDETESRRAFGDALPTGLKLLS